MKRIVAAIGAMLLFFVLSGPAVAFAHASLVSSTPSAGSVLEESPKEILLQFDEEVSVALSSVQLFDQTKHEVVIGDLRASSDSVVISSTVPVLANGVYAVVWRVTSADGHGEDGAFSFQVGTEKATVDAAVLVESVRQGVHSPASVGRTLGVARFAAYLGTALLLGGLFMVFVTASETAHAWPTRRLLWFGWMLIVIASAANFGLLAARSQAGTIGDSFRTSTWGDIANTRSGAVLIGRLVLGLLYVPVIVAVSRTRRAWWSLAVPVLGVLTLFSFSGAGHPSVTSPAALWMSVDAIHVGFIAIWLGGLAMIALNGRQWLHDETLTPAVHTFSKVVTIGVPLIVITGVAQTLRLAGGLQQLTDTSWGRVLLAKAAVASLVVTMGGASRWLLHHDGPGGLRKTVTAEAFFAIGILGLAAGLVSLPPKAPPAGRLFSAALVQSGTIVDVSLSPGHVGDNEIHFVITPAGGNLKPVVGMTATMTLPSAGTSADVVVTSTGINHFTGTVVLPSGGAWVLDLQVATTATETVPLTSPIPIPAGP